MNENRATKGLGQSKAGVKGNGKASGTIAFALGGLAGNNAHGAGFLEAALACRIEPVMLSCTSGQIYWVYQYLRCRSRQQAGQAAKSSLRPVMEQEIENEGFFHKWLHNVNLDWAKLAFWGRPGFFVPAGPLWFVDAWRNTTDSLISIWTELGRAFYFRRFLEMFPCRLLAPDFPQSFYEDISRELRASDIGIVFNSYDPADGQEYVYLNDKARELLRGQDQQSRHYLPGEQSSYRGRTTYEKITPEAVRRALWLYFYGFDGATQHVDGAYYRDIILSELTHADVIYAVRPMHFHWSGDLPRNWPEMEDFKTKIGFNGAYAGERYQIELMNKLAAKELKGSRYHRIEVREIELCRNRGFFGYVFEDMEVFDDAYRQGLDAFEQQPPAPALKVPPPKTAIPAVSPLLPPALAQAAVRYSTDLWLRTTEKYLQGVGQFLNM